MPSLTTKSYSNINEVYWKYSNVGPNYQPREQNAGGKAIPSYAEGRGNGTGRINFIYVNPKDNNNVFACSPTGGLFVTYNGGESWANAGTDQLPISGVSSVCINPKDQNMWIIATGDSDDEFMFSDGVWLTRDSGKHWVNINGSKGSFPVSETAGNRTYVGNVKANPNDFNSVFVASNKGLYVTHNALDNPNKVQWKKIDGSFYFDIEVAPWDSNIIVAGGNKFILSEDGGKSWKNMPLPEWDKKDRFPFLRLSLEFTENDYNSVYCAVINSESNTKTVSGEATLQSFDLKTHRWSFIRSLRKRMGNMITTRARAFAISPKNKNIILTANVQPVYRSVDAGLNFEKIEARQMHDDVHDIEFDSSGDVVWAGHDGGVSKSSDGGLTWKTMDNGIGVANVFGLCVSQDEESKLAYGGYDTGGNVTIDGEWAHLNWGDGFQTIIHHSNSNEVYVTRQNGGILRSDDGGRNSDNDVKNRDSKMEWHSWIRMNVLNNTIYGCGKKLSRSFDKGENWETIFDIESEPDRWHTVYKIFMAENHPHVMYAYLIGKKNAGKPTILRTTNLLEKDPNKIIWEEIEVPVEDWVSGIVVNPENPYEFWISYKMYNQGNKIFQYRGRKFVNHSEDLGYAEIQALEIDKETGQIYLGTNYGLFTRKNDDENWTLLNGLPGTQIRCMDINYNQNKLFIGTFGRGIWECNLIR